MTDKQHVAEKSKRVEAVVTVLSSLDESVTLEELALAHIRATIRATGGNKTQAAIRLGISRRKLYHHLAGREAA